MERLDSTLRALLRAGAWELMASRDVPKEIIIDEYVELAKAFFDDSEAKFGPGPILNHTKAFDHRRRLLRGICLRRRPPEQASQ